jgi:hypothetical protein
MPGNVRPESTAWSSATLRGALAAGCCLTVAAATLHGDPAAYLHADPALGRLLRGMALIKALIAAVAVGALMWRFGRPIARLRAGVYLAGAWFMAGAAMLVWQLSHIALAAVSFHAGELTLLFIAWREHRTEMLQCGGYVMRRPSAAAMARAGRNLPICMSYPAVGAAMSSSRRSALHQSRPQRPVC